nr:TetR/AcrR family transcriptional regulator [uncultured Prevotella sp.]
MRKSKKDILYSAAFKLFLSKQYDGVSLSDIEQASGMTKGAVYYYAASKIELFKKVIEYYIIDKQQIEKKVDVNNSTTFKGFIDSYIQGVKNTIDSLQDILSGMSYKEATRAYVSLIFQISQFFPDLNQRFLENRNNELGIWCVKLQKGIESRELKQDIKLYGTAKLFMSIFYGTSFLDSLTMGLDINVLKEQMYNLYNLLKR